MERVYTTMKNAGACNITIGIIILVIGLITGIISIVYGSVLLKRKNDIVF
ncbi:MAG: hypothetical protein ACI39W_11395 [Brotaphodocola sp.]